MIASGHTQADNIGGLDGTMHRVAFTLPTWEESFQLVVCMS
ncbi:chitinase C-terminal domain-containing protein [Vibrio lentus]|nr:chitinase C-terminal domain-containing protein [Vibrio lentus]